MTQLLAVAAGGAFGAVLRYLIAASLTTRLESSFPLGTFGVNVIGCFLIGVFIVVLQQRFGENEALRLFLIVGLLGGFTTFSAFSLDTVQLIQSGLLGVAFGNVLMTMVFCFMSTFFGLVCARWAIGNLL